MNPSGVDIGDWNTVAKILAQHSAWNAQSDLMSSRGDAFAVVRDGDWNTAAKILSQHAAKHQTFWDTIASATYYITDHIWLLTLLIFVLAYGFWILSGSWQNLDFDATEKLTGDIAYIRNGVPVYK